jgi:hypothetical protein
MPGGPAALRGCSCSFAVCHKAVAVCRDPRVTSLQVSVEYAPRLWRGSGVFFAFQLVVFDMYRKELITLALQKTEPFGAASAFGAPLCGSHLHHVSSALAPSHAHFPW